MHARTCFGISVVAALLLAGPAMAATYDGNGNVGYGGAVGGGSLTVTRPVGTGYLTFTLTRGGGDLNDAVVIYIDSVTGGFADTTGMSDEADDGRRAISGSTTCEVVFGFAADYGIVFDATNGGYLFALAEGGDNSLAWVANLSGAAAVDSTTFTFDVNLVDLGITVADEINFVVTYLNPGSATLGRSDEAIGDSDDLGAGNPGDDSTVTFNGFRTFYSPRLNEVRINQATTGDPDEYVEIAGFAGDDLAGLTFLIIGDVGTNSGEIEEVKLLTGHTIPADGIFLMAESTLTLGTADYETSLNLEDNDNVTYLLVDGFTGANSDDIDLDDDGVLDTEPWAYELDRIAFIEDEVNPAAGGVYHYGPPTLGPDGSNAPSHGIRCSDAIGGWGIGSHDQADGLDTPGGANYCPEMAVLGNATEIVDGDATPDTTDGTDFGDTDLVTPVVHTFTIQNSGNVGLELTGTPAVAIAGTDAADFVVTASPTTPVALGDSTTFDITFTPGGEGLRTATVSIASWDGDERPYDFAIQGNAALLAGVEMRVLGLGVEIASGDALPDPVDDTDFGAATVGSGTVGHTFTIQNIGDTELTLNGAPLVEISGAGAADFSATDPTTPVAPGSSVTFDITFAPLSGGLRIATVSIANDDGDEDPYTFDVQGAGVGPEIGVLGGGYAILDGDLIPDATDGTDFEDVLVGTPVLHTFAITNTGTTNLVLGGTPVTVTGDAAFEVDSQPAGPIGPGASEIFGIRFTPNATGPVTTTVSIVSDDNDENPFELGLRGAGVAPEIDVLGNGNSIPDNAGAAGTDDDTNFGSAVIGFETVVHTFTVENNGTADLELDGATAVALTGSGDFAVTAQPGVTTIAAGGDTTFEITFTPSSAATVTATVSIDNTDGDEDPYDFVIQGTGIPPAPEISVLGLGQEILSGDTSPSVGDGTDFGSAVANTDTVVRTFTIANTGVATLTLDGSPRVDIAGDAAFTISTQPTGNTIAAGATLTFQVTFTPTAMGSPSAVVSIANNDDDEGTYTFTVWGTATAGPEPEITVLGNAQVIPDGSVAPLTTDHSDFGDVDVDSGTMARTFTIQNNGSADLALTDASPYVQITGDDADDFTLTTPPTTPIAPSGETTFTVTFDPNGAGIRIATISIANSDTNEDPYDFAIQGIGTLPAAPEMTVLGNATEIADGSTTPATLDGTDFGTVFVGGVAVNHTFTIGNTGNAVLNLSGSPLVAVSGTGAADFTVTVDPTTTVAASDSTTFTISFAPSGAGTRNATVTIANDDADENPYDFAITGAGTVSTAICGDNIVSIGAGEKCDDGNTISGDGCAADCMSIEDGYYCSIPGTLCVTSCGDGVRAGLEVCDDGAANSDSRADACRTDCSAATCGDGVVDTGESCDDGAANSDDEPGSCKVNCSGRIASGTGGTGGDGEEPGGCNCSTNGGSTNGLMSLFGMGLVLVVMRRRRR